MRTTKRLVSEKKKAAFGPVFGPRRWEDYQVDNPRYGGVKSVSNLTEAEAKDELCEAQDLIAKMMGCSRQALVHCEQFGYGVK